MKREVALRSPFADKPFDVRDVDPRLAALLEGNFLQGPITDADRDLARARLKEIGPVLTPITKQELRSWLLPIVVAVRNPSEEFDVEAWIDVLHLAMVDVPRGLFTVTKQRWVLRQMRFMPSPAEVWDAIKDDWVELMDHVRDLRMIAGE